MGYGGYLIKVGDYKVPFKYILADTFQSPLLGQDKDCTTMTMDYYTGRHCHIKSLRLNGKLHL